MRIVAFRDRIGRSTFFGMTVLYILVFVFAIVMVVGGVKTDLDLPVLYAILGTIGLSARRVHDFRLDEVSGALLSGAEARHPRHAMAGLAAGAGGLAVVSS